jgi:MFS family permease
VLLGVGVYLYLNDGIAQAQWLSSEEKAAMQAALASDEQQRAAASNVGQSFSAVLRNGSVWMLGVIYFCIQMGVYAINFWLPSIIKSLGFQKPVTVGWLSAVPYLLAAVFMVWAGRSADKRRERRFHVSLPMVMGLIGLLMARQLLQQRADRDDRLEHGDHGRAGGAGAILVAAGGLPRALPQRAAWR